MSQSPTISSLDPFSKQSALLEALQRARHLSPYYRRLLVHDDLSLLEGEWEYLANFPLTLPNQFAEHSLDFLADEPVHIYCSSGTTGKPKYTFFSPSDLKAAYSRTALGLRLAGLGPGDILAIAQGFGIWMIGTDFVGAADQTGISVLPLGKGPSATYMLGLLATTKANAITSSPTYLIRLAEAAADRGIDLRRSSNVSKVILAGEVVTPLHRRRIEDLWGNAQIFSCYGLSECGTVAVECSAHDGLHLCDDDFVVEVINPSTKTPIPDGEKGELILTTLHRTGMPLVRYCTGDLVSITHEDCPCGLSGPRVQVYGRLDESIAMEAGEKIWPYQIEALLSRFPEVLAYQLVAQEGTTESVWLNKQDELILSIVLSTQQNNAVRMTLPAKIEHAMREMSLDFSASSVSVTVRAATMEELISIDAGKMPRIVDLRPWTNGTMGRGLRIRQESGT